MLDRLQRIAQRMQILLRPALAGGFLCLVTILVSLFFSTSHAGDRLLIPGFVGLLWAISLYFFIVTFRSLPKRAEEGAGFFRNAGRHLHRSWYWLVGMIFFAATAAALMISYRMLAAWLSASGG